MIEYQVYRNMDGSWGFDSPEIEFGSIAINIPGSERLKDVFVSLFIHKHTIEQGLDALACVSADKNCQINKALFLTALMFFSKCFQKSKFIALNKNTFFKFDSSNETRELFSKFDEWRNKHFVHEDNSMIQATGFLILAPEGSDNILGGPPSCLWNEMEIDYWSEGRELEKLMQSIHNYVCHEIDNKGDFLFSKYSGESREELLSYGFARLELATVDYSKGE